MKNLQQGYFLHRANLPSQAANSYCVPGIDMDERDATELIEDAVGDAGPLWADVGAGSGTFTRALRSILPGGSRVYAIDSDPRSIRQLHALGDGVIPVKADFSRGVALPGDAPLLDGILMANALHFVRDAEGVLRRLVRLVRPGGRVVIVEYDRRAPNPWVPYPIRSDQWPSLARAAGLTNARITARMPSLYAGELYVGAAERST
jgi:ubiquinone/menaquinone biosynthesis C-methylase UbiE